MGIVVQREVGAVLPLDVGCVALPVLLAECFGPRFPARCCRPLQPFISERLALFQVNVSVDYIRPASSATDTTPAFSERTCATVTIGGM